MRIPIFTKLFLSLFVTSIVLVASMELLIGYSFKSGFQEYLNQQEEKQIAEVAQIAARYHSSDDGWLKIRQSPEIWRDIFEEADVPFPILGSMTMSASHVFPRFPHPQGRDSSFKERLYLDKGAALDSERAPLDREKSPPKRLAFDGSGRASERPSFEHLKPHFKEPLRGNEELIPISHRVYLIDEQRHWVIGSRPMDEDSNPDEWHEEPVMLNGDVIGWLVFQQKNMINGPIVTQFYAQQQSNILLFVCLAGLASLIVALILVRHFLSPLKQLKEGASVLSKGNFDVTFQVKSNDEFSALSDTFQLLVDSLKKQKDNREQWLVDISHELRTPIAVLRSELEAIQDGVRQANDERVDSMHHQVMGLGRLVDDLYVLSKTDSGVYEMDVQTLDFISLVETVIHQCEHRIAQKGLNFEFKKCAAPLFIEGDEKNLGQLMLNLLENSLRYTDVPGEILVSIMEENNEAVLRVEDSAPSVDAVHLPKLFGRLYRVDQSRSREHGGSGLGLSIGKNIVTMHGGKIVAEVSALGGLAIEVRFKKSKL